MVLNILQRKFLKNFFYHLQKYFKFCLYIFSFSFEKYNVIRKKATENPTSSFKYFGIKIQIFFFNNFLC